MQTTKTVNTLCVSQEYIDQINNQILQQAEQKKSDAQRIAEEKFQKKKLANVEEILKKCDEICNEIYLAINLSEWLALNNGKIYNKKNNIVVPNPKHIKLKKLTEKNFDQNNNIKLNSIDLNFYGLKGSIPTLKQAKDILQSGLFDDDFPDYILVKGNRDNIETLDCEEVYKKWGATKTFITYIDRLSNTMVFPICNLDSKKTYVESFLEYSLIPEYFSSGYKSLFCALQNLYKNGYVTVDKDVKITEKGKAYFLNNGLKEMFNITVKMDKVEFQKPEPIQKKLKSETLVITEQDKPFLLKHYIDCDKIRADMESYDLKRFEDPNMGHWELWGEQKGKFTANTDISFVARNPLADVKNNCIVGIDFGTKSTIVVYQDGNDNTQPMRIGIGKLNKKATIKDFENPTIMEFINFESFIKDYTAEKGRPHTKWNDLTVSYTASNSLTNVNSKSDEFYSFFYDLKQWAGDNKKQVKIKDKSGHEKLLYSYVDLQEDDFDPIEIYAYYIGLYINNMNNGIYLNYLLSFPVTYEKEIRKKLLKSFEKGIKKSLPQEVLNDEKCMKSFKVKQGASEPEAYAICALQQYGFEPINDEQVAYAIFDFGGGTTDFDFGIWKAAPEEEEDIYDYEINHFGSGGDKYLGGENLLELLAYTVFCDHIEECRKQKIVFCKPDECIIPENIKYFISQSQEAKMNTKQLMEKLRPFWERKDKNDANDTMESIKLALFDRDGNPKMNVPFEIDVKKLNNVLYQRIEKGVRNFFEAFKLTFGKKNINYMKSVECINIFLAGNSSKSPIVQEIFDKYIKNETENISKKYDSSTTNTFFKIFPPLGTKEAMQIQRKLKIQSDYIIPPTGKTGVAFGLVEGRQGGRIKVIADEKEAAFSYYIGINKRKKFKTILSREEEYHQWHRFITAKNDTFEIYYTDLPEATTNELSIINISKKILTNEFADENKSIFIRFVKPNVIEYAVSFDKESIDEGNAILVELD